MCYICLKDNPFDMADRFAKKYASKQISEIQAKAIFIKQAVKAYERSDEQRCHVGDATLNSLKDEQYKIARQM